LNKRFSTPGRFDVANLKMRLEMRKHRLPDEMHPLQSSTIHLNGRNSISPTPTY
jgi:hypothetical protein